jgi:hypothetical protein
MSQNIAMIDYLCSSQYPFTGTEALPLNASARDSSQVCVLPRLMLVAAWLKHVPTSMN